MAIQRNFLSSLFIFTATALGPLAAWGGETVLIPAGAVWRYNASGQDLGISWRNAGFDDSSWPSGPAQLGYGDGDEATLLPASPVRPCYYFRHSFQVTDPTAFQAVKVEVLRDDGCVVYLNGSEVARLNMPAGTITYNTWASTASEYSWDPPEDVPNLLVPGTNILAVEVHQANSTSTDLSLDLRLTASSQVTLTLASPADNASGLSQPVVLSAVPTSPTASSLNVSFYGRPLPAPAPDFSIVVLPDIQNYTAQLNGGTADIFLSQIDWITSHQDAANIAYVAQLGDVSNNGDSDTDESEWVNAFNGFARMEAATPEIAYGVAVGNHDQMVPAGDTEPTTLYNRYFGVSHFQSKPWFQGAYDSRANNQYQVFNAGGLDFIVIYLEYDPTANSAVLNWANALLQAYPAHRGIVVSHYILDSTGAWGAQGQAVYNALKANPNLFLMLCGHMAGEARRSDVYNEHTIHSLLADYQAYANGGNGFLRILQFSPANNQVHVRTFSPWLGQYETDPSSDFTLDVPLGPLGGFGLIQQITSVASGTTATASWNGLTTGGTYEWYASATDGSETASTGIRRFTVAANAPPTVAITYPSDEANLTEQPVTIAAQATDQDGTVATVQFFDGETMLGETAQTPYTWTFTPAAGDHFLRAVAYDNEGAFTASPTVHVTVGEFAPPPAPTPVAAQSLSPTQVQITWTDNSTNELGFKVFMSLDGVGYSPVGATGPGVTSMPIGDLTPATHYWVAVQAYNGAGLSEAGFVQVTTPALPPPPTAPSGLTAAPASVTEISLTWADNSRDELGFVIERSIDGATWTQVAVLPPNTTALVDSGLTSGSVYYYRAYAYNDYGASPASAPAVAAPFIDATAAGELLLVGTLSGDRSATFAADSVYEGILEKISGAKQSRTSALEHQWTFNVTPGKSVSFLVKAYAVPSGDGEQFVFAWSPDNQNFQEMLTVSNPADTGTYQVFGLPASSEGTIYIRVRDNNRAIGSTGLDSLRVDHMVIRTDAGPVTTPPAAPELTQATAQDAAVVLTWNASAGASSYDLYRRTGSEQDFTKIASTAATTYADAGLQNGIPYAYKVTAVNSFGESGFSNALSATPQAPEPPVAPGPPTNLSATGARRKITLSWVQSPSAGITQNLVYRSSDGANFSLLTTLSAATSYTDAVGTGATFTYYVKARSANGDSAPSNFARATSK